MAFIWIQLSNDTNRIVRYGMKNTSEWDEVIIEVLQRTDGTSFQVKSMTLTKDEFHALRQ